MDLDTPCKFWTGAVEKTGYGRRKVKGKMWMAHRFAYQEHYGDLDLELTVDHLRFNRSCVEPAHLRQITREENAVRHKDGCRCSPCNPGVYQVTVCPAGHDISSPDKRTGPVARRSTGNCLMCERKRNRGRMREHRAALKAQSA